MNKNTINIIIFFILTLIIGILFGYAIGYYNSSRNNFPEIKFTNEINPKIATLKLMEIKNGELIGEITGRDIRIAYSPESILSLHSGDSFQINTKAINLSGYYKSSSIPPNTMYVASKKGKYYYSVFSKQALRIKNENKMYFTNEKDAKNAGYTKK